MDQTSRRLRGLDDIPECADRVVSLARLREVGVTRETRRAQVEADRWRAIPNRGVVLDHGPLVGTAAWHAALLQVGSSARLGGVTALQVAGMTGYDEPSIHVWVRKSTRKGRVDGVVVHETRRWGEGDALDADGIPRATAAVATVQAALGLALLARRRLCSCFPCNNGWSPPTLWRLSLSAFAGTPSARCCGA